MRSSATDANACVPARRRRPRAGRLHAPGPGWTYAPAPSSATRSERVRRQRSASAPTASPGIVERRRAASASASASGGGGGPFQIAAQNIAFDTTESRRPPDTAFQIQFDEQRRGIPHNVAIHDQRNAEVFKGEIFNGPAETDLRRPGPAAGEYTFVCTVHPNMTGTLTAGVTSPASSSATRTRTPARSRPRVRQSTRRGRDAVVVLDRTVFYPGGGGQPSDRGSPLRAADGRSWTVRGARKVGRRDRPRARARRRRPAGGRRRRPGRPRLGPPLTLMRTHTALHALCGVVWRDYGAQVTGGNMEPGRAGWTSSSRRCRATSSARSRPRSTPSCGGPRRPVERPAARRGLRDPGPDPDQDQPAARGHRGGPDDRDRRARPAGRRRDPRREHPRGRRDPGHRLRVEGPDQQADPQGGHQQLRQPALPILAGEEAGGGRGGGMPWAGV